MFYSNFIYAKKGPLAKVWMAAHFTSQRKLKKTDIAGTDVAKSAKSILDPENPLALRLRGQLLLGLVRIYQRQVQYLQEDCSDALTKMKMIYRPSPVDLAPDNLKAKDADINMPTGVGVAAGDLHDADFSMSELFMLAEQTGAGSSSSRADRSLNLSVAREGDITLQDRSSNSFAEDHGAGLVDDLDSFIGGDSLIDFDDMGVFGEGAGFALDDLSVARSDSMEVEVGRDALEMSRMNDSNIVTARRMSLDAEADASRLDELSFEMDMPEMDMPEPLEEAPAAAPRPARKAPVRKRKMEARDKRADLEGKVIQRNLRDASDILTDRRLLHTSKRAKFYERGSLHDMMMQPSLAFGTMAPQLAQTMGYGGVLCACVYVGVLYGG
jgi:hypothetical protein